MGETIKKETVGLCEGWCGRVDRHLVSGLCKQCHERSTMPRVANNAAPHKSNINLFLAGQN